ncbi:MAG TPA: glycosyltransferase family 4 protein [Usitatibacter sp.]|nr:glycosyltransferase family 4 protein [Usitatibacter sp.]
MWLVLAAPAIITWLAIALLLRSPLARRLVDRPNERSLHAAPTPRVGGLAVLAGALPVAAWTSGAQLATPLACAVVLALVSLADDYRSLPVAVRLAAHLAAAGVVAVELGGGAAITVLVALAIAWMTNLFNFMDGADGLAGGMAMIGFSAYAVAAGLAGAPAVAAASLAIASAAAGFLAYNFPPARVFLGDVGSIPLGFLAGALGCAGFAAGAWPAWFPLLVFSPFIVDASATLLRRIVRGERFWRAHRSHYYQRLVLSGWTQGKLALAAYGVMLASAGAALLGRAAGLMLQCAIILGAAACYAVLLVVIDRHLRPRGAS